MLGLLAGSEEYKFGQLGTGLSWLRLYTVRNVVFESLVEFYSELASVFLSVWHVLPITQFTYRKGLGTYDAILCVAPTLQSALEMLQEAEWFRSTSVLLLTGSTIKGFSSSSALWESEVQCCLS